MPGSSPHNDAKDRGMKDEDRYSGFIESREEVCGGAACVARTRIAVWFLCQLKSEGVSDSKMLEEYEGLTQEALDAAWRYADDHRERIAELIEKDICA